MAESRPEKKDPKARKVVLKSVRITRPKRVIRTRRVQTQVSNDEIDSMNALSLPPPTPSSEKITSASIQSGNNSADANRFAKATLWRGATNSTGSSFSFLDRICQPNLQYKIFLLFLSIWGASFIMFYLSTSFAIILPEPFNLVVLGFFLISTSLSGIYTFLLGVQHLRNTRQSSDDSYY